MAYIEHMRTTLNLDGELCQEIEQAASVTKQKKSNLMRMALRTGLGMIVNRSQAPRPEGYFTKAYSRRPAERVHQQNAYMARRLSNVLNDEIALQTMGAVKPGSLDAPKGGQQRTRPVLGLS